jgi:hypothetical protein
MLLFANDKIQTFKMIKEQKNSSLCVSHEGTQQLQLQQQQLKRKLCISAFLSDFTHPISMPLFPEFLLFNKNIVFNGKGKAKRNGRVK